MLAASKGLARSAPFRPLASLISAAARASTASAPQHRPPPAAAARRRLSVAAAAPGMMASSAGLAPRAKAVLDYWCAGGRGMLP